MDFYLTEYDIFSGCLAFGANLESKTDAKYEEYFIDLHCTLKSSNIVNVCKNRLIP